MMEKDEEIQDKDLDRLLHEKYTSDFRTGYIYVKGVCLVNKYKNFEDAIENFKVRDDDVWVCSFPKTGTTWTQEMVWCIANDLDFDGAKTRLQERFPFIEFSTFCDYSIVLSRKPDLKVSESLLNSVSFVDKMASPRFIKCHLPFELLPREIREGIKKPKIIYVARNPKDSCISYFHHALYMEGYRGNFELFCKLFLAGKVNFAPYWQHVLGFWSRRNNENILFLKYEDMKADLESVIRKTADFLGKSADGEWASNNDLADTNIKKLLDHLSFKSMKSNPAVNYETYVDECKDFKPFKPEGTFIRKGEIGQWKTEMTQDMCEKFDKLTREHFADTDLPY